MENLPKMTLASSSANVNVTPPSACTHSSASSSASAVFAGAKYAHRGAPNRSRPNRNKEHPAVVEQPHSQQQPEVASDVPEAAVNDLDAAGSSQRPAAERKDKKKQRNQQAQNSKNNNNNNQPKVDFKKVTAF